MAEKPDELNLPASSVARVVKETLPEGVRLSKDAQTAICKAASMFVLYCAACSNTYALKSKRKTLVPNDVFSALEDMEFESFIPELKESLEVYKEEQKSKLADRKRKLEEKSEESQQKRPTEEVVTLPKESDKEQDDVGDAEVVEGATMLSSTHQSSADVDTMSTEHRQDS